MSAVWGYAQQVKCRLRMRFSDSLKERGAALRVSLWCARRGTDAAANGATSLTTFLRRCAVSFCSRLWPPWPKAFASRVLDITWLRRPLPSALATLRLTLPASTRGESRDSLLARLVLPSSSRLFGTLSRSAGIPLNDDCPPQCALLVRATWGDCYCSAPTFQPQVGDPPINSMSVQDIFAFFGKPSVTALQMQCRTWMQTPASMAMWQCNSTRTGVRIA